MEKFVLETILPDGPHWYGGIRKQQKGEALIQGAEWSPYWEDRREMDQVEANLVINTACAQMPGAKIVHVMDARSADTWKWTGGSKYEMRAKFLSVNLMVKMPGYTKTFVVVATTEVSFILQALKHNGSEHLTGTTIELGKDCEKYVTIVGKKKVEVFDETSN